MSSSSSQPSQSSPANNRQMPAPDASKANRRDFLCLLSAGAAVGWTDVACGEEPAATPRDASGEELLDSPPVLQNPTGTSVTIVWAVRGPVTGWVEYGPTAELGQRADAARHGLLPLAERFLAVRLTGLAPGKPVFYRVCVAPVKFHGAYKIERGDSVASRVYQYTPPSAEAEQASFAVINDTHQNQDTLVALTQQLAEQPADVTVWNGDVVNDVHNVEQIVEHALRPAGAAYAAERPVLFVAGNHDVRGPLARELAQAFTPWNDEEPLGRCFAVRQGPLALVGLDTGEDKPDEHPVFAGLANFWPYHEAQRDWLRAALRRPEIAAAPFVVVFCHIPLWGLPGHNGGETLEGYAYYARHAQRLWHPVLAEAKVSLVISGHMHQHRYDTPNDQRTYGQLVGGGPQPQDATLIRATATPRELEVTLQALDTTELGRWKFPPRSA